VPLAPPVLVFAQRLGLLAKRDVAQPESGVVGARRLPHLLRAMRIGKEPGGPALIGAAQHKVGDALDAVAKRWLFGRAPHGKAGALNGVGPRRRRSQQHRGEPRTQQRRRMPPAVQPTTSAA